MWVKVAIAVFILWWLSRKSEAAPAAPAPTGVDHRGPTVTVDVGPSTVTFHEGSGLWDQRWVKPAGSDDGGCYFEPGTPGMLDGRYVCP